ncbi:branched-chain amino acid ABC transporter permease [Lottiidibacillus patelloidae]|uniref:Branched-chain amino acid ABC transporter permease n=1 Tax=Lottiidibacillus patelloidae TaxID=2670334 RepID=A0A263C021_9BACI|nr:AzlC family ABC transporter permease [Lottiidibacillus patelloidae]OZM58736.1 branched-chain amino acid ABC transporter permease [Lottiidibacillus patelloidae]
MNQNSSFLTGIKAGISIAIGYLPIAITFGLLSKSTGLNFLETISMSIFVFAGAAQYIALSMIAVGTTGLEIVLTTFIVNIRHLLMGMSINEKSSKDPLISKLFYSFGITDETFTVAMTQKNRVSNGFMFGLITISYGSWVINTGVGFIIGANLPEVLQESMGIALFAMFIGLLVPAARKNVKYLTLATGAAILNSLFSLYISMGWAIVLATVISAILIELIWKGEVESE